ncbi:glutathione S-transferase [Lentithecium fluviatile CBS 122367]|uniref:glutathione transferase n=1 Tax=Lentithecium fluviatile CBS 122367 TaxID=1168545 RepID=A0A6G1ICK3_9PLEO|nr:glutathione S-transferase [Lentithecium fluviatile CBS 122367]
MSTYARGYTNYIEPLLLAEELQFPHVIFAINSKDEWYYDVHPERYVPAVKDQDPDTNKDFVVFESTAYLQYLAERFDVDGTWSGKNAWEKAQVVSWTADQTAGLGATAKYWLYFSKGYPNRQNPELLPKTMAKCINPSNHSFSSPTKAHRLHANVLVQWDKLEKRLSEAQQQHIALPDRPTVADISCFPFAMPWMFRFLQVEIKNWPQIEEWGNHMLSRPAVQTILERGPLYCHGLDE